MSDRGLPQGYRFVNGYSSHTYSFINADDERFWIKFHFKTMQGIKTWTNAEAAAIVGADRESSQRDLFEAIESGDYPKWRVCVQVMPEADAEILSPQSLRPDESLAPRRLSLDRNRHHGAQPQPRELFRRYRASRLRAIEYRARHQLLAGQNAPGAHHVLRRRPPLSHRRQLRQPARQQAQCPVHTYHRDGKLRFDGNYGGAPNYEPNSMGGPSENPAIQRAAAQISPAMPTATTTATATTTIRSRAISSA